MIDDRSYSVVGPYGYERRNVTREHADRIAEHMLAQMRDAGWAGKLRIYYRDGTCVRTLQNPR